MLLVYALGAQYVVVLLGISQQCEFLGQRHSHYTVYSDQMLPMHAFDSQHVAVLLGISQQCGFDRQRHSSLRFRFVIFGA